MDLGACMVWDSICYIEIWGSIPPISDILYNITIYFIISLLYIGIIFLTILYNQSFLLICEF